MREIQEVPSIGTLYDVFAQGRAEPGSITLFKGWTRLTTDDHGEMQGAPLQGFYAGNTQFLTHYEIRVNGKPVSHRLSAQLSANEWSTTGALLRSGDSGNLAKGRLPKGSIEVRILRKVDQGWSELIFVKNNGIPPRKIRLELRFCCPIRDSQFAEEMKTGTQLPWKGLIPQTTQEGGTLGFRFEKDFGKRKHAPTEELRRMYGDLAPCSGNEVTRALEVRVRPKPGSPSTRIHAKPGKITVIRADVDLGAHAELCLEVGYSPSIDQELLPAPEFDSLEPLPRIRATVPDLALHIDSSNSTLNLVLGQAMTDLRSLNLPIFGKTHLDKDRYMAFNAGIPRYIGFFGRDNLVAVWQSPLFGLDLFQPVLSRLELLQGVQRDDERDEELNRLPHERRLDPISELGGVNRELYYGDVTSTPFWILALSKLYQWRGDLKLLERHRSTVVKCCDWIVRRLKEVKGFLYYAPSVSDHEDENRNQAWKDSGDAIVDGDGRVCIPPLAVAEIQGYAYQALLEASEIFRLIDREMDYTHLAREAQALKKKFNQEFWMEEKQFYAVALDVDRKVVAAKASNVGHCLDTGILDEERIPAVVRGLMAKDMFSGWGVRTLSSDNPGYDPFSYHRGAVWPVENAFIANGLATVGFRSQSLRVSTAQLGAAALFQHMRLPEVLSGHSRSPENPTPGIYNFGNLFQTWSVSAIVQHMQTILGVRPRADQNELYLDPELPDWLQWIELKNLNVGSNLLNLRFWRDSEGKSHWKLLSPRTSLKLLTGKPKAFGQSDIESQMAS